MKKALFLLFVLFCSPVLAARWPQPTGYVNDFAKVIPADQDQSLETLLTEVEQKTGAQIAVVTVEKVDGADIDGAAVDLFKAWGIGKKGKDNGVLLLAAIEDHKARIEVGYGLEGVITDGQAGSILRHEVFPFFKQENYGQGLLNGANAIAQMIARDQGVVLTGNVPTYDLGEQGGLSPAATFFLIIIIIVLLLIISRFGRRGFWGGYYGGWGGGGWSGGGWGGGGGGGFGGFGGGGSGGGGASGGW